MWELSIDLWNIAVIFLAHPAVRALTTVVAITSAALGLWATRKAQQVLHTHEQHILVSQRQLLTEHWQRLDAAILSNDSTLNAVAKIIGVKNKDLFRRHTFLQMLVNLLAQAATSRQLGTLSDDIYAAHFNSVAYYFQNRADLFFAIAIEQEYTAPFIEDCKSRFAALEPLTKNDMNEHILAFAALLNSRSSRSLK